jgi:hypothetical protein
MFDQFLASVLVDRIARSGGLFFIPVIPAQQADAPYRRGSVFRWWIAGLMSLQLHYPEGQSTVQSVSTSALFSIRKTPLNKIAGVEIDRENRMPISQQLSGTLGKGNPFCSRRGSSIEKIKGLLEIGQGTR